MKEETGKHDLTRNDKKVHRAGRLKRLPNSAVRIRKENWETDREYWRDMLNFISS